MKITVEVPDVLELDDKMYKPTGKYSCLAYGDVYLNADDYTLSVFESHCPIKLRFFIYEEVKPWRADEGDIYFFVDNKLSVKFNAENGIRIDNQRYERGNYFRTEELGQLHCDHITEYLQENREYL